jgi:hypothetical protein
MILTLALALTVAQVTPLPSAPPLKVIITVKSSPLCQSLTDTVFPTISGLQSNDRIIASTKPVLQDFGRAWVENNDTGQQFDQAAAQPEAIYREPAAVHNADNPAMILDARRLARLAEGIVHNLRVIDGLLADPRLTPELRAQLEAVANQQRQNLNVIYGLADTFELQDLIAHGDNTQGALNGGVGKNAQYLSFNDQDVSFQDVLSGPQRGHPLPGGAPRDPTVDTDPAISQKATGVESNNPIYRFYVGVTQNQLATAQAENQLLQAVQTVTDQCKT